MSIKTKTTLVGGIALAVAILIIVGTLAILSYGQARILDEREKHVDYKQLENKHLSALAQIPPGPGEGVIDLSGVLSLAEQRDLQLSLDALAESAGIQMNVFFLPTFAPTEPDEYSKVIAEVWEKNVDTDQWVLLAVGVEDGEIRYDVSTKLASVLTPEKMMAISADRIEPQLRAGDFYSGMNEAILAIGGQMIRK